MLIAAIMAAMGGPRVQHPVGVVLDNSIGAAIAYISYESDGDVVATTIAGGAADVGDWIAPKAAAPGAYTIRAEVLSGLLAAGSSATDTDLALTSTRSWGVEREGAGTTIATIRLTIKLGGAALAIRDITLGATAT